LFSEKNKRINFDFQIHKVPATDIEALKLPLMGLFEKCRARKFFIYVQDYEDNDPKSHEGLDLTKVTAREVIAYVFD
jgi:Rab GDP dissociation inhibitor